jgi:hypothetical protein
MTAITTKTIEKYSTPIVTGLIIALVGACATFYNITRISLAQLELRIAYLENRMDKQDTKFDAIIEKLGNIEKAVVRLEAKAK